MRGGSGILLRCAVRPIVQIKFDIWHALFDFGFINPKKSFKMTELELECGLWRAFDNRKASEIPIERVIFAGIGITIKLIIISG